MGILHKFPRLVQATSSTPTTQPCLVPASTRWHSGRSCLFVLNTPDAHGGSDLKEVDVSGAWDRETFPGLRHVTRHNSNIFVAEFEGANHTNKAQQANRFFLQLPATATAPAINLLLKADYWGPGLCHAFVFEPGDIPVSRGTIDKCVFDALEGPLSGSFRLSKQERTSHDRFRYILRSIPGVQVQQFYFPLDAMGGKGKVWGIFEWLNTSTKCWACGEKCQTQYPST